MLSHEHRLRRSSEFARVRKEGRAWSQSLLVLTAAPNGGKTTRVGFSISKRVGKACVRNRTRRLLRESVRLALVRVKPGYDLVLSGRPAIAGQPYAVVDATVQRLLRQANLLQTGKETS